MKICHHNHRTAEGDGNLGHEEGKREEGNPEGRVRIYTIL